MVRVIIVWPYTMSARGLAIRAKPLLISDCQALSVDHTVTCP
jgi:hypothetical protein